MCSFPTQGAAVRRRANSAVVAVTVCLFVLAATLGAIRKDVAQGFDEVAHASYVAQVQRDTTLWPDLTTLRLLDPQTFAFTAKANYLNHLPFYYDAMAVAGPRLDGHPRALLFYRLLNVFLASMGLATLLAIGLAAQFDRLELYAYCVPLFCIPVLAPLAGAVNNDNAAFLGGAAVLFGLLQLLVTKQNVWLWLALGGVVVAGWAKLTGLLLTGTAAAALFVYLFQRKQFRREWIIPIVAAIVLAGIPYAVFLLQYGSPAPDTPAQQALLQTGAQISGWAQQPRLSFLGYAAYFSQSYVMNWMPSLTPRGALQFAMLAIPAVTVALAGGGVFISLSRIVQRRERPLDVVVVAGAFAVAATFACHFVYSYQRHVATGWMMDAYPRYYLSMIAIVPLACLSLVSAARSTRSRSLMIGLFVTGPIVFRIFGAPLPF